VTDDDLLEPKPLRDSAEKTSSSPGGGGGGKGFWIALAVVAVGLGVIVWISRMQPKPVVPRSEPTPTATASATPDPALREKAEAALEAFTKAVRPLRAARVDVWGGETWQRVETLSEQADQAMADGEYELAARTYTEAVGPAEDLNARMEQVPDRLFPEAERAYARGEREEAVTLLEAVLAVDPEHGPAKALLPRAKNADRSFAMLERATGLADETQWGPAWVELNRLKELDPVFPGSEPLRKRVSEALAEEEFQEWITKAVLAVEQANLDEAETWLNKAASFRPDHPAVRDVREQVEELRVQRQVLNLREEALALEKEEKWAKAHEVWLRISALDPHTPWVKAGKERTLKWKLVEEKLDRGLKHPHSAQTAEWVEEFKEREGWPDGLEAKAEKLVRTWTRLQQPVPVVLRSDAETTVMISKVGKWKPFVEKQLELKPGEYVARGIRLGYRDVRVPFEVKPGQEKVEVKVVCVEGI